jgi:hypothetical protein
LVNRTALSHPGGSDRDAGGVGGRRHADDAAMASPHMAGRGPWWPLAVAGMWKLATGGFGLGHPLEYDYASLAFPFVLVLIGLAAVVLIGLSGEETNDEDLEWWSRFGGWLLIVVITWLGASFVVLGLPHLFRWVSHEILGIKDVPGLSV